MLSDRHAARLARCAEEAIARLRRRVVTSAGPASLVLRVVPSARGARILRRHRRLTLTVRVTYRPAVTPAVAKSGARSPSY